MCLAMRWVIFRDPVPPAGPSRDVLAGGAGYRAGCTAGPDSGSAAAPLPARAVSHAGRDTGDGWDIRPSW
jgi:hypothetical protein